MGELEREGRRIILAGQELVDQGIERKTAPGGALADRRPTAAHHRRGLWKCARISSGTELSRQCADNRFRSTGIQAVGVIGDVCSIMILARPKGQEWSRICHIRVRQWKINKCAQTAPNRGHRT
jgi:hypothetical protein